jgi:hypothetical protein
VPPPIAPTIVDPPDSENVVFVPLALTAPPVPIVRLYVCPFVKFKNELVYCIVESVRDGYIAGSFVCNPPAPPPPEPW